MEKNDEQIIKKYNIIRKNYLSKDEINKAFHIIANNMKNLGYDVSDADKEKWIKNLDQHIKNPNFYFYLIYVDGVIAGFIEILKDNTKITISEVQLDKKFQKTKLILHVIKFIFENDDFANYSEALFNIAKKNVMSNKTFSHLGGKIIAEHETHCLYAINKEDVQEYLNKLVQKK